MTEVNKNYKDTVFRMIFKEKKELLSLYNAVNGTSYSNPDELEINTLENAVYLNIKNDVSCILDMRMNLYEHQSSVNPNMPLRNLFYVARQYEKFTKDRNIYSSAAILLPTPKFITFYNGVEPQPERCVMRLSDSFQKKSPREEAGLELIVTQLNINPGFNEELKENCPTLREYMEYVTRVRKYQQTMSLEEAVDRAVDECIKENILAEFLKEQKAEVKQMSIFEYDQEKHMQMEREENLAKGRSEGITIGIISSILTLLDNFSPLPENIIRQIKNTTNEDTLRTWVKNAQTAKTLEEFVEKM